MSIEDILLDAERGSITAPAGCGKTHAIARALSRHQCDLPILVLTHTNAGVDALRRRLHGLGVPSKAYRISTIDGFAKRLVATFPRHSGISSQTLELTNPRSDYPKIRQCAIALLGGRHHDDVLSATYARLFVDEYQDCSQTQHKIILGLARPLSTCVLGDPMQAIFGFAEPLVDWDSDVRSEFPAVGELDIPWRWINANTESLGYWLLDARKVLERGGQIDLRTLPELIEYVDNPYGQDDVRRQAAMRARASSPHGSVLVIGDSRNVRGRHQLASQVPGATVVERVDLVDLTVFGHGFTPDGDDAITRLLTFASTLMTGLSPTQTLRRLETLRSGRGRNPPSSIENALLAFDQERTFRAAHRAIICMQNERNVRVYRHEVLRRLLRSLDSAAKDGCSFYEATIRERERFRHRGRPLRARNIGSTLLLKGLEAEVAVILQPEDMDSRHLYVALTRASHKIIVCSSSPLLPSRG